MSIGGLFVYKLLTRSNSFSYFQNSIDLIVVIPRPGNYRLLIRYVLNSDVTKRGQVTIAPKQAGKSLINQVGLLLNFDVFYRDENGVCAITLSLYH